MAHRIERERGLSFVHPFDDPDVIAGQGTIGLELAEQVPGLAVAVAAVSGGGLIGGLGIALKGGPAPVRVVGASAENAAAMVASLRPATRWTCPTWTRWPRCSAAASGWTTAGRWPRSGNSWTSMCW